MGDAHQARRPAVSYIGHPIHFSTGQFAGQTVRTELIEVQKADLGRKYARVDRRPLDPPPAVLLKLYFVYNPGTEREIEREVENYDDIQNLGLLCNVDLFPVPASELSDKSAMDIEHQASSSNHMDYASSAPSPYSPEAHQHFTYPPPNVYAGQQNSVPMPPPPVHVPQQTNSGYHPPSGNLEAVAHVGNHPITEHSKCTNALVGQTFVQPANVDYKGQKSLMFVFADLAVKIEGTFILRYRVFDIFSKGYHSSELAVQAECYGGPFRVYSTKEFPGLHASTDLTKQLARWGVRLNIRETERKRRKKGERRSTSPPSAKGKGKRVIDEQGYGSDDD